MVKAQLAIFSSRPEMMNSVRSWIPNMANRGSEAWSNERQAAIIAGLPTTGPQRKIGGLAWTACRPATTAGPGP